MRETLRLLKPHLKEIAKSSERSNTLTLNNCNEVDFLLQQKSIINMTESALDYGKRNQNDKSLKSANDSKIVLHYLKSKTPLPPIYVESAEELHSSELLAIQAAKMKEIIERDSKSEIIHLRVSVSHGTGDGFKKYPIPQDVLAPSETLLHIIASSSKFREQGKYVNLFVSTEVMEIVIDFLQRKYLGNCGHDMQVFEPFDFSIKEAMLLLETAAYLGVSELVDVCIKKIASNFSEIESFGDLDPSIISKILKRLTIGEFVIAVHELLLPGTVEIDQIWTEMFWKLPPESRKAEPERVKSAASYNAFQSRKCIEFFTSEVLSRQSLYTESNPVFKVIHYAGFTIKELQIDVSAYGVNFSNDAWTVILSKLPKLQLINLDVKKSRSELGSVLSHIAHNCESMPSVVVNLYGSLCYHTELQYLKPLCIQRHVTTHAVGRNDRATHLVTENDFKLNGNEKKASKAKNFKPPPQEPLPIPITLNLKACVNAPRFEISDLASIVSTPKLNVTPFVTTLEISNIHLGYDGAKSLIDMLSNKSLSVHHLILPKTGLTSRGIIELLESLVTLSSDGQLSKLSVSNHIRTINLESNIEAQDPYVNDCFKLLGSLLSSQIFPALDSLNFSNNMCSSIGMNALMDGLEKTYHLNELCLSFTPQINTHLPRLANILNRQQIISSLVITDCRLLPRHLKSFFEPLKQSRLTSLDISRNTFDIDTVDAMADWLAKSKLRSLSMSGAGDDGNHEWARRLIVALAQIQSITKLDLSTQGLGNDFCIHISSLWAKKKLLNILEWNLQTNNIQNKGAKALLKRQRYIPSKFISVDLHNNPIQLRFQLTRYNGFHFHLKRFL
jgi:hypothetical protein